MQVQYENKAGISNGLYGNVAHFNYTICILMKLKIAFNFTVYGPKSLIVILGAPNFIKVVFCYA
jgi:hypothetical protein